MRVREEEQEALRLLKKHLPRYSWLTHSEKPDLIDCKNSLGVEVTRAVNTEIEKQVRYFYDNMKGKSRDEVCSRSISQIEKRGLGILCAKECEQELSEQMHGLVRVFGIEENSLLNEAICAKYAKKYQNLDSIDLYVFFRHMCRDAFTETDFMALLQTAHDSEIKYGKVFKRIMIDFYTVLVILDLERDCVEEVKNYGD